MATEHVIASNKYSGIFKDLAEVGFFANNKFELEANEPNKGALTATTKVEMEKALSLLLGRKVDLALNNFSLKDDEIKIIAETKAMAKDEDVLAVLAERKITFAQYLIEEADKNKNVVGSFTNVTVENQAFGYGSGYTTNPNGETLTGEGLEKTRGQVRAVQEMLVGLGYSVGKKGIDGKLGQNTFDAITKFSNDQGLYYTNDDDKLVTKETLVALARQYAAKNPQRAAELEKIIFDGKTTAEVDKEIRPVIEVGKAKSAVELFVKQSDKGVTESNLARDEILNENELRAALYPVGSTVPKERQDSQMKAIIEKYGSVRGIGVKAEHLEKLVIDGDPRFANERNAILSVQANAEAEAAKLKDVNAYQMLTGANRAGQKTAEGKDALQAIEIAAILRDQMGFKWDHNNPNDPTLKIAQNFVATIGGSDNLVSLEELEKFAKTPQGLGDALAGFTAIQEGLRRQGVKMPKEQPTSNADISTIFVRDGKRMVEVDQNAR